MTKTTWLQYISCLAHEILSSKSSKDSDARIYFPEMVSKVRVGSRAVFSCCHHLANDFSQYGKNAGHQVKHNTFFEGCGADINRHWRGAERRIAVKRRDLKNAAPFTAEFALFSNFSLRCENAKIRVDRFTRKGQEGRVFGFRASSTKHISFGRKTPKWRHRTFKSTDLVVFWKVFTGVRH